MYTSQGTVNDVAAGAPGTGQKGSFKVHLEGPATLWGESCPSGPFPNCICAMPSREHAGPGWRVIYAVHDDLQRQAPPGCTGGTVEAASVLTCLLG
jgi:hypothetical protein